MIYYKKLKNNCDLIFINIVGETFEKELKHMKYSSYSLKYFDKKIGQSTNMGTNNHFLPLAYDV